MSTRPHGVAHPNGVLFDVRVRRLIAISSCQFQRMNGSDRESEAFLRRRAAVAAAAPNPMKPFTIYAKKLVKYSLQDAML